MKDNRPPKEERTLKRGDVREDGMVFWEYRARYASGERWVTKEDYEVKQGKQEKYYQDNRDSILKKKAEYYVDNKSKINKRGKDWYSLNAERQRAYRKSYYEKNQDKCLDKMRERYNNNPEKAKAAMAKWRSQNREKVNSAARAYDKSMRKNPQYRLVKNLRSRLSNAVRLGYGKKCGNTLELIGCSFEELKGHLSSQFAEGMTWGNYGEWHVDHIKPCAKFDLTLDEEQKKCFHYSNLQPLWAKDNLSKGAHYEE